MVYNANNHHGGSADVVKKANRVATAAERQDAVGTPPDKQICPDKWLHVGLEPAANVRVGDICGVTVIAERIRVEARGQVIGWITDPDDVAVIQRCREAGGLYEGRVISLNGKQAVVDFGVRRT